MQAAKPTSFPASFTPPIAPTIPSPAHTPTTPLSVRPQSISDLTQRQSHEVCVRAQLRMPTQQHFCDGADAVSDNLLPVALRASASCLLEHMTHRS